MGNLVDELPPPPALTGDQQAVALIDAALPGIGSRSMLPSDEIMDLLLDIRRAVTS